MMLHFCSRQEEVAAALRNDALSETLRVHISECRDCAELMLVTQTFQQARAETTPAAQLHSPSLLWWRAQLRRRYCAVVRATRPVVLAEKFALLCMLLAAFGLIAWQSSAIVDWVGSLEDLLAASSGGWMTTLMIASLGTFVLFSGLAVYLFAKRE